MLKVTGLTVRRGPRVLFAGASFSLFRGEKTGITGENGSGKSTLLELVRGVVHDRLQRAQYQTRSRRYRLRMQMPRTRNRQQSGSD